MVAQSGECHSSRLSLVNEWAHIAANRVEFSDEPVVCIPREPENRLSATQGGDSACERHFLTDFFVIEVTP